MTDGTGRGLPVLDRAALERQAGGDAALAAELLRLFAERLRADAGTLRTTAEPEVRLVLLHRIKGSSLAVGAAELAAVAGAMGGAPDDPSAAAFDAAAAAVLQVIDEAR